MMNDIAIHGAKLIRGMRKRGYYLETKRLLCYCESIIEPCSMFSGWYLVGDILFIAYGKPYYDALLDTLEEMGVI